MRFLEKHQIKITIARTAETRGLSGGLIRAETGLRSLIDGFRMNQRGHFVKTSIGYKRARKWDVYAEKGQFDGKVGDHVYFGDETKAYNITNVVTRMGYDLYECEDLG
jgi:hypothetical protein